MGTFVAKFPYHNSTFRVSLDLVVIKTNPFTSHSWKAPWRYTSALTKVMTLGHPQDQKWHHVSQLSLPSLRCIWFKNVENAPFPNLVCHHDSTQNTSPRCSDLIEDQGTATISSPSQLFLNFRIPWLNLSRGFKPKTKVHTTYPTKNPPPRHAPSLFKISMVSTHAEGSGPC